MITFICYAVIVTIGVFIFSVLIEKLESKWYVKNLEETDLGYKWKKKIGEFLFYHDGKFCFFLWAFFIFSAPLVYEFGYVFKRGYVLFSSVSEGKKTFELKRLNWYGTPQILGTWAHNFTTPNKDSDNARLKYSFIITDSKKGLITSFDLIFEVDYPRFVQQTIQAELDSSSTPDFRTNQNKIDSVFVHLSNQYQNSDFPIEEISDNAISIANEWLQSHKVTAVKSIVIKKNTGPKNPERTVVVQ